MFKRRGIENFWNLQFLTKFIESEDAFIAGGCFKNLISNQPVKDVDIYFTSSTAFDKAVASFTSKCERVDAVPAQFTPSYQNDRVIAFNHIETGIRVELIRSIFGTPEQIIGIFDFTVTKFALFLEKDEDTQALIPKIIHHEDFFEHLHTKRLVIDDQLPFPVSSFERSYKYRDYGFKLCRESKMKLVMAIRELPTVSDDDFQASLYAGFD